MNTKYEVIESLKWFNTETKQTASIYGANPFWGDRGAWIIQKTGYTVRNIKTGIVGIGRIPWKSKEEAEKWINGYF